MAEGVLVAVGVGLAEPGVGLHHVLRHAGAFHVEHGTLFFLAMAVAVGVCCEHD